MSLATPALDACRDALPDDLKDIRLYLAAVLTGENLQPSQAHLIGKLALAAAEYARREGFAQDGYRIVMNCREDAGQTVFHIHMHLLAGAPLGHFGTPGR